jgi:hypothetical protein
MPGVMVRDLLCVGGAALAVAAALDGCGGTLGGSDPGGAGRGGSPAVLDAGAPRFGEPACLSTVARGQPCGPQDQQLCYKTCGPERTGVKALTCSTSGIYNEMSGCAFDPSADYSCYAIPTAANAVCPLSTPPMAAAACEVEHCVLCNSLGGVVGGQYFDSTGAPKVGWCTCQLPNAAGMRTWTCASDTAWPCPTGAGCLPDRADAGAGGQPICTPTVAEGVACGPADQQSCSTPCAPGNIGWNAFGCIGGVYAVMSNCRPPVGGP